MREMLTGGDLTIDRRHLAELTMLIRPARLMEPDRGYGAFLAQLEDCLGRHPGARIVANAGGLNPGGWPRGARRWPSGSAIRDAVARRVRPRGPRPGLGFGTR
jgi:hypothetical protein